jgi:hypothetical protein
VPHASFKLAPGGVNSQETQAQNENGGIFQSQLIRFFYDAGGWNLVAKLGGWTQWVPTVFSSIIRALWAWEDLNDNSWLAVGTQTNAATGYAQLAAITNGMLTDITPHYTIANEGNSQFAVTSGSNLITITDITVTGLTNYDTVFITTQVSIGGVVLFGQYAIDTDGYIAPNVYHIFSVDQLGNPFPATSTTGNFQLPVFTSTSGTNSVNVNLPNYTYAVGTTFAVLTPTVIGGVTIYGNYIVQSLVDANNFTILVGGIPSASTSVTMNNNNVGFIYNIGKGAISSGTGYGVGAYGSGGYGSGSGVAPATGTPIPAVDWTLDNFGQVLIGCAVETNQITPYQPIYQWTPGLQSATVIPNAPTVNDGVMVAMPQRQIIAWGSTQTGIQDPLLINWCDVGNYNQWIALVTNQAGSYRIPKGSRIVGAVQGPQQGIIWTDIDCWSMQYIGPPYVYSFNEIGTGCGLIARKAAAACNGIYYWMGPSQFFMLSSEGVQTLQCSIWDVVYQNLSMPNLYKIRVAVNSRFNEIQWFYPSATGTGEVDSYVKYNTELGAWDYGTLARTAWVDQSVLGPPIGADPNALVLYQHETSNDAAGQPMTSYFQSGYYAINEGDLKSFIDLVWPDFKWGMYGQPQTATLAISFYVVGYPGDTPVVYGPYTVTQATKYFNTRLRGRLVSIRIQSSDLGSFWRIGNIRYRYAPDGKF